MKIPPLYRKEKDLQGVSLWRGKNMDKDIQKVIDKLEALQLSILLWQRKEDNEKVKNTLSDYDKCLDEAIDILFEYGI